MGRLKTMMLWGLALGIPVAIIVLAWSTRNYWSVRRDGRIIRVEVSNMAREDRAEFNLSEEALKEHLAKRWHRLGDKFISIEAANDDQLGVCVESEEGRILLSCGSDEAEMVQRFERSAEGLGLTLARREHNDPPYEFVWLDYDVTDLTLEELAAAANELISQVFSLKADTRMKICVM